MLFYMGYAEEPNKAVLAALSEAVPVLLQTSSLIVDLLELNHTGKHWEAHIRLMIMNAEGSDIKQHKRKEKDAIRLDLKPKSPEHFRSGSPFEWKPANMKHDKGPLFGFDNARYGGNIPDIPAQDVEIYKRMGLNDLEIKSRASSDHNNSFHPAKKAPKLEND